MSYTKINAAHLVKVGDIFVSTWGYDQTNADFFQVVKVNARTVRVRPIESRETESGFQTMSGHATPVEDAFCDVVRTKTPYKYERWPDGIFLPSKYGSCKIWDGDPVAISWYA